MTPFFPTSIRASLFVAGILLIGCGLAVKGFLRGNEYGNHRFAAGLGLACLILIFLLAGATASGLFEAATRILSYVVEPAHRTGANLSEIVPFHRQAIQTIGATFVFVLTPLLLVKKNRALPLLFLLQSGGMAIVGSVFLSRLEVNSAFFFITLAAVGIWC